MKRLLHLLVMAALASLMGCETAAIRSIPPSEAAARPQAATEPAPDASAATPTADDAESSPAPDAPAPPAPRNPLARLAYPKDAPAGDDLDIAAEQKLHSIILTNRTARVFDNVEIWVNQQYVAMVSTIQIGGDNRVLFRHLVNRYGEHYPDPGLLTPDKAYPAVLVELFDPAGGRRHRLLARPLPNLMD